MRTFLGVVLVCLTVSAGKHKKYITKKDGDNFPVKQMLHQNAVKKMDYDDTVTPTVLWHGMGDSCCNFFSMGRIKRLIEKEVPGVFVYSICIGRELGKCNIVSDTLDGFLGNVSAQIDYACESIKSVPQLAKGFNMVGFSQGGLFSRALVQRCPEAKVKSLVSIGGPQNGVYGFPSCPPDGPREICEYVQKLLNIGAYRPNIQSHIVQAQYWHDAIDEQLYVDKNIFLPALNMLGSVAPEEVERLNQVENFVLVKFNNDTVVIPKESEHFGFYNDDQSKVISPCQDLPIWNNLGLKTLNDGGKLIFLSTDGDHLQFSDAWFTENIIPYLEN